MLARLSAFVIWALVAATAVFWALRLFVHASPAPAYTVAVADAAPARSDLTRLLGRLPVIAPATVVSEASSRYRLLGIVAPKYDQSAESHPNHGVALIAVDGKMPKAFAVGAHVDGDTVLQSVSLRSASLLPGQGGAAINLELPLPTVAATGTLPVGMAGGAPVPGAPFAVPAPQYSPTVQQPAPVPFTPQAVQPQQFQPPQFQPPQFPAPIQQ